MRKLFGIIGYDDPGRSNAVPSAAIQGAEEVGSLIARRGVILVSGGRGGVMEAASKGASREGGLVVGLLPSKSKYEANQYVSVPIATGLGRMRNTMLIRACDAIIMIGGGPGTLNEAILAYGSKPLVVLEGTGGWADRLRAIAYEGRYLTDQRSGRRVVGVDQIDYSLAEIHYASSPSQAVEVAFELAERFERSWSVPALAKEVKHSQVALEISDERIHQSPIETESTVGRVQRLAQGPLLTHDGFFTLIVYQASNDTTEHLALVNGDVAECDDLLVRINSACLTSESFGALECECSEQLHRAMTMIAAEGKGVIVYLRQEGRGNGLVNKVRALQHIAGGLDTVDAFRYLNLPDDTRDYQIAADILRDLGVSRPIRLLTNNPTKVSQLEAYGIPIVARVPLEISATPFTIKHLHAKRDKLGHLVQLNNEESDAK